jgi:hypothetical protein
MENTALDRNRDKIEKKIYELKGEHALIGHKYGKLLRSASSEKEKERIIAKRDSELAKNENEVEKLEIGLRKNYGVSMNNEMNLMKSPSVYGRHVASKKEQIKNRKEKDPLYNDEFDEADMKNSLADGKKSKRLVRDTFYSKGNDIRDKKPGRYLDALDMTDLGRKRNLKESTDDMRLTIYETELSGDISIEERNQLLNILDNHR